MKKAKVCSTGYENVKGKCYRKYNDNITLMDFPPESFARALEHERKHPLKKDEYYALMVTDWNGKRGYSDTRTFFDEGRGWLGLERTGGRKIYISKKLKNRHSIGRGSTVIVKVKDTNRCCRLTY